MDSEEKILRGYNWAYQRVHQFDHLLLERTNMFLLSSSILFAGFVLLFSQLGETAEILFIIVAFVGILLALQHMFNSVHAVRELIYWIKVCRTIEEEDEVFDILREKDLVYIGYMKWINGQKNRYTREKGGPPYKAKPLSKFERIIFLRIPILHPWNTYRFVIPFSFIALWTAVLIWLL